MARSTYIYIVRLDNGAVIPFTVKYEAQACVRERVFDQLRMPVCAVERYRDGDCTGFDVYRWSPEEFLK